MTPQEIALIRAQVLERYHPNSCVMTVKTMLDYMASRGESGRPLAVEALAWRTGWPPGTRAVQLGGDDDDGVGHVVILTVDSLIDPSLDQAARPERGLDLGPVTLPLTPEQREALLAGQTVSWQRRETDLVLAYTGRPRDKRYTASPNWGKRDRRIRGEIGRMTARLANEALRA